MSFIRLDLDDLRSKSQKYTGKTPFPHQQQAFEILSRNFTFPIDKYSGGLLVLPTGFRIKRYAILPFHD